MYVSLSEINHDDEQYVETMCLSTEYHFDEMPGECLRSESIF